MTSSCCSDAPPLLSQTHARLQRDIVAIDDFAQLQVLEAMADGGVQAGLPRHQALQLAAQSMKGAACMVLEGGHESKPNTASALGHPGVLKDQVRLPYLLNTLTCALMYERPVFS